LQPIAAVNELPSGPFKAICGKIGVFKEALIKYFPIKKYMPHAHENALSPFGISCLLLQQHLGNAEFFVWKGASPF